MAEGLLLVDGPLGLAFCSPVANYRHGQTWKDLHLTPRVSGSAGLMGRGARAFVFLTSSQVMRIPLVWGLHFGNHCCHGCPCLSLEAPCGTGALTRPGVTPAQELPSLKSTPLPLYLSSLQAACYWLLWGFLNLGKLLQGPPPPQSSM